MPQSTLEDLRMTLAKACLAVAFVGIAALGGCKGSDDGSGLKTNLGALGNKLALQEFTAYQAKPADRHCVAAGDGKRVIVSGFGLFSGAAYNISGVVVESMMNPSFWSGEVENKVSKPSANSQPSDGRLQASYRGGKAVNRTIKIDGKTYQACFILLDVKWDIAGAIVAHEMSLFKPDMVLMTGRGAESKGVIFEGGAINNATYGAGYAGDGHDLGSQNRPVDAGDEDAPILEGKPSGNPSVADKILMSWDNAVLAPLMAEMVKPLQWTVTSMSDARSNNDYICNNVSYIALYAAKGEAVKLAGETISIQVPQPIVASKVGFMHYPYDAPNDRETVQVLATGLGAVIGAQLK